MRLGGRDVELATVRARQKGGGLSVTWPNALTELHVKRITRGLVSQTALHHCPVAVDIPR